MRHVDSPRPTDGKLNIRGWAVAESGMRQIAISIADKLFVPAQTGLLRVDVAKRHPEFPGAENSGFSAIVDVSILAKGNHIVRVYATTRRGRLIGHRMSVPVGLGYWQAGVECQPASRCARWNGAKASDFRADAGLSHARTLVPPCARIRA